MKEQTVLAADAGIRLDRWFKRHAPGVPHGLLEKSLRKGLVRLDGKKAAASDRVTEGQMLRAPEAWFTTTPAPSKPKPRYQPSAEESADLSRRVLYKNAHLLVINKPYGLAVQGGTKQSKSLDDMLDALRLGAAERPRLVHRLDKDTTGCLLLARNAKAAATLAKHFASRAMEKRYVALVIGLPELLAGDIQLPLAKASGNMEKMVVDEEEGKPSHTRYRVLEHLGDKLSWVELFPVTGRTHQLRVHMAAIGHPIVGDGKYGGREATLRGMEFPRSLHLHAASLTLPEALGGGKTVVVHAPLPPHIHTSRTLLGMDAWKPS